jgi:flagellar L-ring protein precursor FlgH
MRRAIVLAAMLAGCEFLPPKPLPPVKVELPPAPPPKAGSLWHPELSNNYATLDVRAHFPGDLLTVVISEVGKGKQNATTGANAKSSISASVDDFFGLPAAAASFLPKGFNPQSIVTAETARSSAGDGTTTRDDSVSGNITVTVVDVAPNGNLRVQGDKIVTLNRENQVIVLTGTVRPEDIASDNSVLSSRLADARVSYKGYGSVSDKQGVPLVHRMFDWVWPF